MPEAALPTVTCLTTCEEIHRALESPTTNHQEPSTAIARFAGRESGRDIGRVKMAEDWDRRPKDSGK
jgi:hypothetical protein